MSADAEAGTDLEIGGCVDHRLPMSPSWLRLSSTLRVVPLLAACVMSSVAAASDPRLGRGVAYFQEAEFAKARDALAAVVNEPNLSLAEQSTGRLYLAASHHALGDVRAARAQLILLARKDPTATVDPGLFLPELVAMAREANELVAAERAASADTVKPGQPVEEPPSAPAPAASAPVVEPQRVPLPLKLLPFGIGQFARGDVGRGAVLLVAQVALLATFVVALVVISPRFQTGNYFERSVTVNRSELGTVSALNIVQFAAFWAAVGVAAIGVVEALLHDDAPAG